MRPLLGSSLDRYVVVDGVARSALSRYPDPSLGFDLLSSSVDNVGNYVHAEAPFNFWRYSIPNLVDGRRLPQRDSRGLSVSIEYANSKRAVFVLSAANFIQFDGLSVARRRSYQNLEALLSKLTVPLIVLGLGAQAPRIWDPEVNRLPIEAISLLQFLSDKAELVSLRGAFTERIVRNYVSGGNWVVTGCPSFFQEPSAFKRLLLNLRQPNPGVPAFSLTNFTKPAEVSIFSMAMRMDHSWIDVRRPAAQDLQKWLESETRNLSDWPDTSAEVPVAARRSIKMPQHHVFLDYPSWLSFSRAHVAYSYGTRLHANMATLLAGKAAIWITHDKRTLEATRYFNLPSLTLSEAQQWEFDAPPSLSLFEPMFNVVRSRFEKFNNFLQEAMLPQISTPQI